MAKLHTGHEFEMEYLEYLDKKEIESALYSIECAQREIEKIKRAGITKQNDEYRVKRKQDHIDKLKKHYGI